MSSHRNTPQTTRSNIPWVEKYRPKCLTDVVHHKDVIQLLRTFIRSKEMPHLFFYGPPGTGKTSTILSCANEIYGKNSSTMVMHLNASDERGVEVVRKQIIQFSSTSVMFHKTTHLNKLVILDEADSMSSCAQQALRDIMVIYDTLFCFIGNYQYAFQPQLQSRVIKLLFTPIPEESAIELGKQILQKENFESSEEDIHVIYTVSKGDMRQFINLLQVVSMRIQHDKKQGKESSMCDIIHMRKSTDVAFFIEHIVKHKTIRECYQHMHHSITQTHQATLSMWVKDIFDYIIQDIEKRSEQYADSLSEITIFCSEIAQIENTLTIALHSDIQLFAVVACVHKFVIHTMR